MDQNALKQEVGRAAAAEVRNGMVLGLGTGSTAEAFLHALANRVRDGLMVRGVPTSERTAALCGQLSIALTDLEADPVLDLCIDGADEIDSNLNLIKGGGGALLREKIVAAAAPTMLVIADASKCVETLGAYPLPIEINPFGSASTIAAIERVSQALGLTANGKLRHIAATSQAESAPFVTDGGHWILDCSYGSIAEPAALDQALRTIPGVVETGLFIGMAQQALIAGSKGIERLSAK